MKKRYYLFFSISFLSIILFACDSKTYTSSIQKEPDKTEFHLQSENEKHLLHPNENEEIQSIGIYKINGYGTYAYVDEESISTFNKLFSLAQKEEGILNMADSKLMMEITYKNNGKQTFYLWLGDAGQKSSIMKTTDTHTLYHVPNEMTAHFQGLVDSIDEFDTAK